MCPDVKGPDQKLVLGHQDYPKFAVKEKKSTSHNHTIPYIHLFSVSKFILLLYK
jgi:hypothetical protein